MDDCFNGTCVLWTSWGCASIEWEEGSIFPDWRTPDNMLISWHSYAIWWGGGEMVDAGDLKSPGWRVREGSIPSRPIRSGSAFALMSFSFLGESQEGNIHILVSKTSLPYKDLFHYLTIHKRRSSGAFQVSCVYHFATAPWDSLAVPWY